MREKFVKKRDLGRFEVSLISDFSNETFWPLKSIN